MDIDIFPEFSFPFWLEMIYGFIFVMSGFLFAKFKSWKKSKKSANIDWNVHSQIHEFLIELRVLTHAARAQIIQFHNGEYFMDGVSMQKLSVTHESLANGVSSEAGSKTNILISHFAPLMEKLDEDKAKLCITNIEKPSYFKNTLDLYNVHSYMILPLFVNGIRTGFLMIQWCSDKKNDYVSKHQDVIIEDFIHARNIIQTKLAQQLKGNK